MVCFDHDGQQVKLLSDVIFSQNIINNFDYFIHRANLKLIDRATWGLHDQCLTLFDGLSFQTFSIEAKQSPFKARLNFPWTCAGAVELEGDFLC